MYYEIQHVLVKKFPNLEWQMVGDDYEGLQILNGLDKPSLEELELADQQLQQESLYKELRQREYPTIEELTVAIMEDKEGRPEALVDIMNRRQVIKLKYPKPA